MRKILRRLTSPVDIAETFAPCGVLYKYVKLYGYDVRTSCFVNLTCAGPASWACAGCVATTNSSWKHVCQW
jgi:hypothetical protein